MAKKRVKQDEQVEHYKKAYPGVKVFYRSSDRLMFLKEEEASAHQKRVSKEKEFEIIKID